VPVRQRPEHLASRRGHRRGRAQAHPGEQPQPGRIGEQFDDGLRRS